LLVRDTDGPIIRGGIKLENYETGMSSSSDISGVPSAKGLDQKTDIHGPIMSRPNLQSKNKAKALPRLSTLVFVMMQIKSISVLVKFVVPYTKSSAR